MAPRRILIATSNAGKLRDFAAAARELGVEIAILPGLAVIPAPIEDQATFHLNARKKAEHYSRFAPGELVLADDSGLEVAALGGAPGIHSARYAALESTYLLATANSADAANNTRLLRELEQVPEGERGARFVCVIAAARDGKSIATFEGETYGEILRTPRGSGGFGYDPLFYFRAVHQTFAELSPADRVQFGHRGRAFRVFLEWYAANRPA